MISYAELEDDFDDDVAVEPSSSFINRKSQKRRKLSSSDESDGDAYQDPIKDGALNDNDLDDLAEDDDPDRYDQLPQKRKRANRLIQRLDTSTEVDEGIVDTDDGVGSTAHQWIFNPADPSPLQPRSDGGNAPNRRSAQKDGQKKAKAAHSEPSDRYPWLANITDADRNPPGHPDYDLRTVYIPPMAWNKFSPFEKQYWEIKQKFWDTIVFFKKGKFYELYETDATIGHQLFDLKLTDRVNMRMVGVPEASLDHWVAQFVAKGYKIARVDQMESALAKEMRESEQDPQARAKSKKEEKVIRRELACVLTAGTLVDESMLQDEMSTYCVAIKELADADEPAFGIGFVDTATGQFSLTEIKDDAELTKFETFIAQIRPRELILEKSALSTKAMRILKTNSNPMTIWNYLKPEKEFWSADITRREIDACGYFVHKDRATNEEWPAVLQAAKGKDLVMSAFGALTQYLRVLKIDRDLISLGNFVWYDPIKSATSLVLEGQTLINLEIFANSIDSGTDGTLFNLLNRCISPFGKRLLRQWVCHPLLDPVKINARLDAVEALNADTRIREAFTMQLSRLPDLERIISRVHAGKCKATDFVRVLEGFEQIEYTMAELSRFGKGEGVIGQLIANMPDLKPSLKSWKESFDRSKAKDSNTLVPERGIELDYDASEDIISETLAQLDDLLQVYRKQLGSTAIKYEDNGKEIYQLAVPVRIAKIPNNWQQMSATKAVKRYYSPELRGLVRKLQEAQEKHGQILKGVAGRFFARFDKDYSMWLQAVKVISQLDCLISLAKVSSALGQPSCRPVFVSDLELDGLDRSVLELEELRHPCMATTSAFIPNDIVLGGSSPNITLLTGANAAGKSTVLRMTCIAVIMAQIGCFVPCTSARLTPVDRIMSRLGANDNIFAAQSTFFVELSETKKILSEATPRSLVILDELGRGTSSYDGVAVAEAVLHHVASHIGCIGFFATHYHSLPTEFRSHPEICAKRMAIAMDRENRDVTFLYTLEDGVAEGSFGMNVASMCGISDTVVERAEVAAREWEHTSRLTVSLERSKGVRGGSYLPLGILSDVAAILDDGRVDEAKGQERGLQNLVKAIEVL